ncbi:hypothetical protein [Streptomyces lavenduligriseus]|uniref:Uncharacterized protein n=1 Tax=Streptomyces lavenduligriseus TaxID=67315 RepID=A0ABT0NSC2_9ACTN|nr:hypothetical protein [Streptomyces lavenduligriseus]MCL3994344.1 hypothetical protein [Streptomyces lavenduligriseus]
MSSISRRSLIGYSGTAAAGAVIAGTASASPAQAAEPAQAVQAESASTAATFPEGTLFGGRSQRDTGNDMPSELEIKFSIANAETPAAYSVTPQEIADAINKLLASRGWPAATFYGTPAPAPLN